MAHLSRSMDNTNRLGREPRSPIAKWGNVMLPKGRDRSHVIGMSTGSGGSGEYFSTNSANSGSSDHHSNHRHNALSSVDDSGRQLDTVSGGGQPDIVDGRPDVTPPPRGGLPHKMRGYRDRTEAWWSMGEFLNPGRNAGLTHQSTKFSLTGDRVFSGHHQEELWDLSDSLAELHDVSNRSSAADSLALRQRQDRDVNIADWIQSDVGSGFIRVYPPNVASYATSYLIPCTLTTTAHQVCLMLGISLNSLHVQCNGDIIQRLDTYEHPLMLQNEYLVGIGYCDLDRIQEEGTNEDLGYLIRFYYGKPTFDSTFSRKQLQAYIDVRKGKMLQQWVPRMCVISGTRLLIYKDKYKRTNPAVVQLAKGAVEEVKFKGHNLCLKLTLTLQGEKYIYLSFTDQQEYDRWHRKCKKATDKLPTSADLSNCHLEFLPETVFINDQLAMLNLRHNALKERPIEEDIYTIGWLDDLPKFMMMRSLNLADNNLKMFPLALCHIKTLVELNIASNKLDTIPAEISQLSNLQALHIHNNHLRTLPSEMVSLRKLFILVLAFNHFEVVPPVVPQLTDVRVSEVENIIMAGNQIRSLPAEVIAKMHYVKKADFRMNDLTLPASEVARFTALEHLTHLDIRDNRIDELDIRVVKTLEYLNCERNIMYSLQVNGTALKNLLAANNCLDRININPKPEWLLQIDYSHNQLKQLPEWLSDCFFLQKINVGHNSLVELPSRLLVDAKKLKSLRANHNRLTALPAEVGTIFLEEVYVQHNRITQLPDNFLRKTNKLRVLNVTKNRLSSLPPLNDNHDLNKVQELYLTCNSLTDSAMAVISHYSRLKLLHIAHNDIEHLHDSDVSRLEMLQELNICGNQLRSLPVSLGELSKLTVLRAHSNALESLPDFKRATSLRVLDVGHNHLLNVSVTNLMASQLNLLDMSLNRQLKVDPREFKTVKKGKSVCLVDLTGQNRTLPGLGRRTLDHHEDEIDPSQAWKVGFSETSGIRNKLSVAMLKILHFGNEDESAFAVFDGGYNDEVPKILVEKVPRILQEELKRERMGTGYMRYTFLTAHKMLKGAGQKLGASAALCHIRRVSASNHSNQYTLHLANVGDVEVVLCRRGEAVVLTRKFVTTDDDEECLRVYQSDGIITEDNKVSGTTKNTRLLGCAYLSPHVIPDPHLNAVALRHDDEFIVIASRGLWKYVAYGEAIEEVYEIGNPIVAAKKLQDLAQGYGSRENISILIVRFNTDKGPSLGRFRGNDRSMSIDDVEAAARHDEQNLKQQRKREMSVSSLCSSNGKVQRHSHRGQQRRRLQYDAGEPDLNTSDVISNGDSNIDLRHSVNSDADLHGNSDVDLRPPVAPRPTIAPRPPVAPRPLMLKPLPNQKYAKKNAASEWDGILQKRLTDDVKDKEMKQVSSSMSNEDVFVGTRRTIAVDLDVGSSNDIGVEKPPPRKLSGSHVITQPWADDERLKPNPAYTDDDSLVDSSETMTASSSNNSVKNVWNTVAMFENIGDSRETVSLGQRKVIVVKRDERTPYVHTSDSPKMRVKTLERECDSSGDESPSSGRRESHNSVVTADVHRPQYLGSVEHALHKRGANCDADMTNNTEFTIVEIARL